MSSKITPAQLNANKDTYAIDDYRKMVNYESGTNKGYVRFAKDANGKLKIEKFNNKIDVPLSWRSNTSAAHNRSVREKFLAAIEGDLKFLGKTGDEIKDLILRPKDKNGNIDTGKALSRRDIKEIFKKFDAEFNNGTGRMRIVENFFASAMDRCGFTGSKDDFIDKYLKPLMYGIDPNKALYFETDEANKNNPDPTKRMKMSETKFRAYLIQLDNLVAAAKNRIDAENACKKVARAVAANPDNFGAGIPAKDVAKIRDSLKFVLDKEGVVQKDLGFGTAGTTLELFLEKVLPVMVRQAAENIRDYADPNNPASIEEILEGELSIEKIVDTARRFIEGANEVVDKKVEVPQDDGEKNVFGALQQLVEGQRATQKKLMVFAHAREKFVLNVNMPKGGGNELGKDVAQLTETYIKEADFENYATQFLLKNYAKAAQDLPRQEADFMDKAKAHVNQLVVAGQLNYGERWALNNPAELKDVKLRAGGNVQSFLKDMSNEAINLANEFRGGMPMLDNLLKHTIPNILNGKIKNAIASNGEERVNIDEESRPAVKKQLRLAVQAYRKFFEESEVALVGKTLQGFRSQLDRLLKKGNITQDEYNNLLLDHKSRVEGALKRAVERFYAEAPLAAKDTDADTIAAGAKRLEELFGEERDAVTGEMRQRISTIVLANAYGGEEKRKLLDVKSHVDACRQALTQAGVTLSKDIDDADLNIALNKLYYKVLEKKMEDTKLGHNKVGEKLNDSVQSSFVSAAKDLVNTVNKLCTKLDTAMRKYVEPGVDTLLQTRNVKDDYKNALSKDELNAMRKSIADGVILSLKGATDEIKRRFITHPETYTKKNVDADNIAMSFFDMAGKDELYTEKNISRIYKSVADERTDAVNSWINNPTGPDGKSSLATDLAVDHMTRVLQKDSKVEKYASSMPKNELRNIVNAAVKEALAFAAKYALSFATGGKDEFMKRVNARIQSIVDKHVESHAKFREAFLKDANAILEKYDDALRTPKKSGKEVATDKMNQILHDISRQKEPPKIKGFALAFDGMLKKMVNDKVDMKVSEFMEYSKKITEAYETYMPAFNNKAKEMEARLREAGADDDDIRYFNEKLMPVLRQKMDAKIQADPDSYVKNTYATKIAENQAFLYVTEIVKGLEAMNPATDDGLTSALRSIGFSGLRIYGDVAQPLKDAVSAMFATDDGKKMLSDARKAAMTKAVYDTDTTSAAVKEADESIKKFNDFLRDTAFGYRVSAKESRFNEKQVTPAVKIFEAWLEMYNLPDIQVSGVDFNGTLKEAAVAHFRKHVADLQQKIAETGEFTESVLSADYIKEFTSYLNKLGREAIFSSMSNDLIQTRLKAIMADKKYAAAYEFPHESADELKQVVHLNLIGLQVHLAEATRRAELAFEDKVVSLEDMHRWNDLIVEEFNRQVADSGKVLDQYHQCALSRVEMMVNIDLDVVSGDKAIDQYLFDALQEHFKGVDITEEGRVPSKLEKKHEISVSMLFAHLKGLIRESIEEQKDKMKSEAMKNTNPNEVHFRFPGADKLETTFRAVAESFVASLSDPKSKDPYAPFFRAVEAEVASILKKKH
ncbi:MAG: hypothetical protein E7049_06400 [Lentisphaerae bacterium]|jgi:hypothetical protein|nr:hypothetical protein [Lentisphaerota bacterium]